MERELLISPAVVNTLNTWANFMRCYYVCCSLGAKLSTGGAVFSALTGITDENAIIGHAVRHFKPRATLGPNGEWDGRDEPKWHSSRTMLDLAVKMGFSHEQHVAAGFSLNFTAHKNLAVFRNYYAHRNRQTKQAACGLATVYGIPAMRQPTEVLLASPLTYPGGSLLDMWLVELKQTIDFLCY